MRTPKLVSAEPTNSGVESPARNDARSTSAPTASSRPISSCAVCHAAPSSAAATSVGTSSSGASEAPRSVRVKRMYSPVRRSMTPRRSPAMPTGHVTGVGRRPIWASISSSSSSGSRPGRSYLLRNVSTGRRRARQTSNSLQRLRLDALGRVEHHHHGVDAGEHAVGVLGEVAVAGRVEQVDDVVAVRELQHGRADRDAPLALELHPVRRRRPPAVAGLDGAGALHGAGVEQELLGQRRLAGVGVADDRERAAAGRLAQHQLLVHDRSTLSATGAGPAGCGP